MDRLQSIKLFDDRFRKQFPNSHLMIGYDISIHKTGTTHQWTLSIIFDEISDLSPTKIFETFEGESEPELFSELIARLSWHMYRINHFYTKLAEEEEACECH